MVASVAGAETPGEARFFTDCPRRQPLRLHSDANPWDLHAALYTTVGMAEVEVIRLADWLMDLPLPGPPVRPFHRVVEGLRAGYHRLPGWLVIRRTGELVDAFQIPEVSLGDATATYTSATGGVSGIGSGTLVRVNKLVDWTQHVHGDLNRAAGGLVGRPTGLIGWRLPGRAVDSLQGVLIRGFHGVGIVVARAVDGTLTCLERVGEGFVNVWRPRPHRDTTVFFRLPIEVYRIHELWILEHRERVVVTTVEELSRTTHAALAHGRRRIPLAEWSPVERFGSQLADVVVMTTLPVAARAPEALKAYVVPAAWVLNGSNQQSAVSN